MRLLRFALVTAALVTASCGETEPCVWNLDRPDREARTAGVSMTCGDETVEVGAFFLVEAGLGSGPDTPLTLRLMPVGAHPAVDVSFVASLPDGAIALDGRTAWVIPVASGSFSVTRTRDVPFVDLRAPSATRYTATATFSADLTLADSGCRVRTEAPVTVAATGTVTTCGRGGLNALGGWH